MYAYFTPNNYTVYFNTNGGSSVASQTVIYNSTYGNLPTPTKIGYAFKGWYLDSALTIEVVSSTVYQTIGDSTLYAKWELTKPTCTWSSSTYLEANQTINASLTCTAGEFSSTTVSTDSFESNNVNVGKITAVSVASATSTKVVYNVTLKGIASGTFVVKLKKDIISDSSNLYNEDTESDSITVIEFGVASPSVSLNLSSTNSSQINIIGGNYGTVTYSSADSSIATVSNTGLITAKSVGTTTITVNESRIGLSRTITVNVTNTLVINLVLEHLTSSNTATTITSGSTYSTTLTPTNALLYGRPSTLEVYINNILTTNYTYNSVNGALSIPNVTGDIKIVATADVLSEENISFESPKVVEEGEVGEVSITQAYQLRIFSFTPTETRSYKFYTNDPNATNHTTDPYAYLFTIGGNTTKAALDAAAETYAANGTYSSLQSLSLAYNDDGGEGYNFLITYTCNAGQTYYIAIRTFTPSKMQTWNSFIIE